MQHRYDYEKMDPEKKPKITSLTTDNFIHIISIAKIDVCKVIFIKWSLQIADGNS